MKELLKEMLASLEKDAEMKDYKLSIEDSDKECLMLIWENPGESERWKKSGYAEYLDNFENVQPMCSLAILEINNKVCAYTLTPEEKYYKMIVLSEDEDGNDEYCVEQIVALNSYEDFKQALLTSIWKME
jgi:hypothetical protein